MRLKLVSEVFLEYESKGCSKEEIENFKNRLNNQLWIDERKFYDKIEKLNNKGFFTVISSTYAHDIYKHLGFIDIDEYSENKNFYPMKKILI